MDGESGMWLMEVPWWVMSLHVRDTFDRGSAVSCCQQLTRGECSLTGPAWPAAFPTHQPAPAAIFIQQKSSHVESDRIGLFPPRSLNMASERSFTNVWEVTECGATDSQIR